jgi:hypothetical protein
LEFTPNKHCWLKVESDGKLLFKDVLPPAVSRKWYADKNFNIVIGNIESGNMFLNGKSINLKKDADGKKNKIILDQSTTAYWLLAGDVK